MIRRKVTRNEISLFVLCLLIVVFILTFYIWHQTESIQIGYSIGELEEEISLLEKEVEKLETLRSQLLALERVERIAKDALHMSSPRPDQIHYQEFEIRTP